jgi:hypothetical protein
LQGFTGQQLPVEDSDVIAEKKTVKELGSFWYLKFCSLVINMIRIRRELSQIFEPTVSEVQRKAFYQLALAVIALKESGK